VEGVISDERDKEDFRICGSHSVSYEEFYLLGYNAV
jgi:hypothetical protein